MQNNVGGVAKCRTSTEAVREVPIAVALLVNAVLLAHMVVIDEHSELVTSVKKPPQTANGWDCNKVLRLFEVVDRHEQNRPSTLQKFGDYFVKAHMEYMVDPEGGLVKENNSCTARL